MDLSPGASSDGIVLDPVASFEIPGSTKDFHGPFNLLERLARQPGGFSVSCRVYRSDSLGFGRKLNPF